MTELNDELLVAYVDGQLAAAQSKAIERVLEEDEVAAERVASLRAANEHLESAFEAMIAGEPIPVPATEADTAAKASGLRRFGAFLRKSAAFAWVGFGCLLGGAAGGFMFYDTIVADPAPQTMTVAEQPAPPPPATSAAVTPAPATWADDMIRVQTMLSPETFTFGLESEGNMDLTSFQISKTLGTDITVPDLSRDKLTFQRAQVLQREGKPFAQIAYLAETGDPVALYATTRSGEAAPMRLGDRDGVGFVMWTQGDLELLLAGNLTDERLGQIARGIEHDFKTAQPRAQDTGAPVPQSRSEGLTVGGTASEPEDAASPAE